MWWTTAALAAPDLDDPLRTGARTPADTAVVVGIEDYVFLPDVPYARRDAALVRDWLVSTRGVPNDRVQVLEGGAREQITAAVMRAGQEAGPDGTVWVYFAGHGVASPQSGHRLLLGDDTRQAPEAFDARGVELDAIEGLARAGGARAVLLVDACFNGTGRSGEAMVGGTRFAVPDWVGAASEGVLQWAAAGPDQFARPLPGVAHGAFTWLAVGALRGWADGEVDGVRDGRVTAEESTVYVGRALERLGLHDQDPVLTAVGPASWTLATGVGEEAPALEADALLVAPPPAFPALVPPAGTALAGWDPNLLATAAQLRITLPLHKTFFGYKDLENEKVRGDDYLRLVKSTKYGRSGVALRNVGLVGTPVGWAATLGFGLATAFTGERAYLGPTVLGGAVLVGGMSSLLVGQHRIDSAVQPRTPR